MAYSAVRSVKMLDIVSVGKSHWYYSRAPLRRRNCPIRHIATRACSFLGLSKFDSVIFGYKCLLSSSSVFRGGKFNSAKEARRAERFATAS